MFEQKLRNRTLILLFENTQREQGCPLVGMRQFGGNSIVLQMRDTQIDRGETIEDAARVIFECVTLSCCALLNTQKSKRSQTLKGPNNQRVN